MKILKRLIILVLVFVAFSLFIRSIYAQGYHSFPGEINSVRRDYYQGQLVITAENNLYVVEGVTGSIIEEYDLPDWTGFGMVGKPDHDYLYGIHCLGASTFTSVLYSINRDSGNALYANLPAHFYPETLIQDETRIFVITSNNAMAIPNEDRGRVFVFNKSDLSPIEDWPSKNRPLLGVLADSTNLIYIPGGTGYFWDTDGDYIPGSEGDEYVTDIGCYDPEQNGLFMGDYYAHGSVVGIAQMSDGAIVVGMEGFVTPWDATLAILGDPSTEIQIPNIFMASVDCDIETNRVFGPAWDGYSGKAELNGFILNWDYDTGEYEIIDSGIVGLREVTYCDGKLYGITTKDNKLYVIDIE